MKLSMRRTGNGWDNAVMESFFAARKAEIGVAVFNAHAHARSCVFDDSEGVITVAVFMHHWPSSRQSRMNSAGSSSKMLHSRLSTKAVQVQGPTTTIFRSFVATV